MTPGSVRRALHATHALSSLLLISTGVLLWSPDLRARWIGGYGREILDVHLWLGAAFLAAPVLAGMVARPLLQDLARRLGPPDPVWAWRKVHIVMSLGLGVLLGVSGVLLWADVPMPLAALDATREVHVLATWLLLGSVPVHLAMARRKIVGRTRELLGRVPASELEPPFFDEDADG